MGRDCLWQVQAADYQVVYVAHYIGLAWCAVSWVYDAVQLPGWLRKSNAKQPLNVCYSTWPLMCVALHLLASDPQLLEVCPQSRSECGSPKGTDYLVTDLLRILSFLALRSCGSP